MRLSTVFAAGLLASSASALPVTSWSKTVANNVKSFAQYFSHLPHITSKPATHKHSNPWSKAPANKFLDWSTFKANGVNLGNWLLLEYSSNQVWWDEQVPASVAKDEWSMCEYLGKKCGPLLEDHYATYYTYADIDKLAGVGVNLLRVPMTYQAWVDVPGSQLYHGHQLTYFRKLTDYAIRRYGMHVVIDLHGLPGGCNGLDNGEALGHENWWFNATNMEYTLQMVERAVDYIQDSGHPYAYTLSLINEAITNMTAIGSNETVSAAGVDYMVAYLDKARAIRDKADKRIPLMWQDSWMGETFWSARLPTDANIVLDLHIYFFSNLFSASYSKYLTYSVCGAGDYFAGDGKLPVFVGEWSDEILYNNSLSDRKTNFDTQRYAYATWGSGSAFWSAKQYGNETVSGEGIRSNYWCYECMIDDGVVTQATTESYC